MKMIHNTVLRSASEAPVKCGDIGLGFWNENVDLSIAFKEDEVKEAGVGERKCNSTLSKMTNQTDDWVKTWEEAGMKYMQNCVFVDEAVVAGTSVFGDVSARGESHRKLLGNLEK